MDLLPAFSWKTQSITGRFCATKRSWSRLQTQEITKGCSQGGAEPKADKRQEDASPSKIPRGWKHSDSCLTETFYFLIFPQENVWKKLCTDYLKFKMFRQRTVSILRPLCSSQGWQIAGEVFEDFTQLRFPSSSSASVPMIQRGMEISPVFFGFQLSCEKVSFSSFYPSQIALEL